MEAWDSVLIMNLAVSALRIQGDVYLIQTQQSGLSSEEQMGDRRERWRKWV